MWEKENPNDDNTAKFAEYNDYVTELRRKYGFLKEGGKNKSRKSGKSRKNRKTRSRKNRKTRSRK